MPKDDPGSHWVVCDNTIRVRACQFLRGRPWSSASQVAEGLRRQKPLIKLSSGTVSSCLLHLTEEGVLVRKSGCGPRGGIGYKLARKKQPRTWHQRLLAEADAT